jgi:hypothetical protein
MYRFETYPTVIIVHYVLVNIYIVNLIDIYQDGNSYTIFFDFRSLSSHTLSSL